MKFIKVFAISLFILGCAVSSAAPKLNVSVCRFAEIPVKTVVIKHPDAADANAYFSKVTSVVFYVYKAGGTEEVNKIVADLKKTKAVNNAGAGKLTGDYQEITVNLKSAKDKAFWVTLFKSAGLNHIKINNGEAVEMDKI